MKLLLFQSFCAFVSLVFLLAPAAPAQQPAASPELPIITGGEAAAVTAAEVWLGLVDDGQYSKAWETGAKILQGVVTEKDWTNLATTKRPSLGKVISRKSKETKPAQTFPGAPEGQYVVIQYGTEFEHKKVAAETVTVALDPSGQWKVCGYYIR